MPLTEEACYSASLVLADDGVMYVTFGKYKETETVAIQTSSPGIAKTGYAMRGYNNRRTWWLAPEQ